MLCVRGQSAKHKASDCRSDLNMNWRLKAIFNKGKDYDKNFERIFGKKKKKKCLKSFTSIQKNK